MFVNLTVAPVREVSIIARTYIQLHRDFYSFPLTSNYHTPFPVTHSL